MVGMPTFILIEWHPKGTAKQSERRLLLYHGAQCQALYNQGLDLDPMACWPMDAVDWDQLRDILVAKGTQ